MSPIVSKIFNEYSSGELYRKVDPSNSTNEEVERISSLILLCYSYQWETNLTELENICNTIEELVENKPIDVSQCLDIGQCQCGICTGSKKQS